jgi:pimeloyl-ACP methyl ester carboxylesterase
MKRALMIGGVTALGAVGLLAAMQDNIIYVRRSYESHGMRQYYHNIQERFEDKSGRVLLEVSYNTSSGHQTVFWIPPRLEAIESKSINKLWIVFGGNAQLALDWVWFISKLGSDFYNDSFLLMDYPGYGRCQGSTSGSTTTTESVTYATERVLSMLYENETTREPDVGVLAHSLGCAAGLNYAITSTHHINKFVLVSPFTSIPSMAKAIFIPGFLRSSPYVDQVLTALVAPRNRWDNIVAVDELATRMKRDHRTADFVVIHGTEDEICPYEQGLEVAQRAAKYDSVFTTKFVPINGGDHNGIIETALLQVVRHLKSKL